MLRLSVLNQRGWGLQPPKPSDPEERGREGGEREGGRRERGREGGRREGER